MAADTEIPDPNESGSDGLQIRDEENETPLVSQQIGRPIAKAITGLAASNPRAFGGEAASTLIAGVTLQMAGDLENAREEIANLRGENKQLTSELAEERVKSAVLRERIGSFRSSRHLKNVGVSIGALLVGLGIQFVLGESAEIGIAGIALGVVLLLASWNAAPKEAQK